MPIGFHVRGDKHFCNEQEIKKNLWVAFKRLAQRMRYEVNVLASPMLYSRAGHCTFVALVCVFSLCAAVPELWVRKLYVKVLKLVTSTQRIWACLRRSQFSLVYCYCQEHRLVTMGKKKKFLTIHNSCPYSFGTEKYWHTVTLKLQRLKHLSIWLLVLQLLYCKWSDFLFSS